MKQLIILAGVLTSFFILVPLAIAQTYENPGVKSSILSVNKTVQKPGTSSFVENLGVNDPKYAPAQSVQFQIVITNTGNTTLTNIKVADHLPQYLKNAADNSDSVTTTIPSLAPGQSQTITLTANIADAPSLPIDQRVFCLVNQATATSGDQTSTDNAQLCVENPTVEPRVTTKGGLPVYEPQPVTSTPSTGPEAMALAALLPTGAFGYFLRRFSK